MAQLINLPNVTGENSPFQPSCPGGKNRPTQLSSPTRLFRTEHIHRNERDISAPHIHPFFILQIFATAVSDKKLTWIDNVSQILVTLHIWKVTSVKFRKGLWWGIALNCELNFQNCQLEASFISAPRALSTCSRVLRPHGFSVIFTITRK